jgi:hypothetical protein
MSRIREISIVNPDLIQSNQVKLSQIKKFYDWLFHDF